MGSPYLIGLGAGLVSAVLFASAAGGSVFSLILFYLAPLPVFLAGFGWGISSVALSGLCGTVLVGVVLGPQPAGAFLFTLALPCIVLCYLASLRRASDPGSLPVPANDNAQPTVEWYPVGRIVLWAAIISGALAGLAVLLLGQDEASYRQAVEKVLNQTVFPELQAGAKTQFSPEELKALTEVLVRILPAASSVAWLSLTLLNMWLAMRIADISERLERPRPLFTEMSYPRAVGWGFLAALGVSWFSGIAGLIATGFVGAFFFAYLLLGLAILHKIIPLSPTRPVILFGLYFALVVFGWLALLIALLAMGDPIFKLRERFGNRPPSPPTSGG